jgi:hypothetical protein
MRVISAVLAADKLVLAQRERQRAAREQLASPPVN